MSAELTSSENDGSFIQEFITSQNIVPDLIVEVAKAKELHSQLPSIRRRLQSLIWHLQQQMLVSLDIPIVLIISHIDEVHPTDLRRPQEYDDEKQLHIQKLVQLAQSFFQQEKTDEEPLLQPIRLLAALPVSSKVVWHDVDGQRQCHAQRDYRYNIEACNELLSSVAPFKILPGKRHFALHLVHVISRLSTNLTARLTASLWSKYQLEAYLVTIIAIEFSQRGGEDPSGFGEQFKQFWLNLGLSPLTVHSLRPIADHLMRQVPIVGHVVAEVEVMRDMVGLEESVRRMGVAAVAHFCDQAPTSVVQRLFSGSMNVDKLIF
jgi:hypothetical protein